MSNDKAIIELKNVNKRYGDNHVVHDLSMKIYQGEFLTLLGPSGCGKTTTLRMIGGFETATEGSILLESVPVEGKEPFERNLNTVFQSYALFPHMTVQDNVGYGLWVKGVPKKEIHNKVEEMLALVQLSGYEKRMPSQLSGGQRQRIAIARALINSPKVLLLDEPLGALDLKLRKQMQIELKRLQKKLNITFVYVTHDQEEALTMSDRIAVMCQGYIEQLDTPQAIYDRPATKFVADFIGESNVFNVIFDGYRNNLMKLTSRNGDAVAMDHTALEPGSSVYLSVRPEKIILTEDPVSGFTIKGIVKEHIYIGSTIKCIMTLPDGFELTALKMAGQVIPEVDSSVCISWRPQDAVVLRDRGHDYDINAVIDDPRME